MKKFGLVLVVGLSFLIAEALGAGSGSSGSRSYSSGSSPSRSYSSGSTPSRSYSSPSTTSGTKTYSSGGSSTPKTYSSGGGSSTPKASPSATSGGKTYSSGNNSTPKVSPSATSGGKTYSSGDTKPPAAATSGGKTYSSGDSGKPHTAPSATSGGKTYSSSNPATGPPTASSDGNSKKPTHTDFNAGLSKAAKEQESKVAYQKATAPKPSYVDHSGKTVKIDPTDKKVEHVRNITHETYITRETRVRTFYEPYYSRPVVYYSDPFGPFFYLWLFDRCSANDRAMWAYQHRSEMDDARWRDMCARDAQLEARVRQLEAEKAARDPNYIPPGIPKDQADLMYNDQFVQAAYNAQPAPHQSGGVSFWTFLGVTLGLALVGLVVYLVFFKDWKVSDY